MAQGRGGFELGTGLEATDYAAVARALGCHGERIERPEEVAPALDRALSSGLPAVIDARVAFVPHPGHASLRRGRQPLGERRELSQADGSPDSGMTARRCVPSPGSLSITSVPSTAATRSVRPLSPEPVVARAPPTPSSRTSTTSSPSSWATRTLAWLARAYLATFVSASATVK